ncbi:hypothetical protein C0989_012192 [Termitomyces sp. Mn162]|nr:hypothetical protein C0989_012192 [Termitomyces sp. Mn162]
MNSLPAVTANVFNLLSESVTDLTNLVKDLALRMNANSSAVDPTLAMPTTKFMAPITTVLTNGMSVTTPTSLCACFPNVKAVVITAIIAHKFKAANLHKLNLTNHDREVAYTFNGTTNQFKVSNHATKEYNNPFAVIVSLQCYFNILSFHLLKGNTIPFVFYEYTAHLIKLVAEYKWSAVFQYHSIFFNQCCSEIAAGDYTGWGIPAMDLLSKHIYMYHKAAVPKHSKLSTSPHTPSNPLEACCKLNEG